MKGPCSLPDWRMIGRLAAGSALTLAGASACQAPPSARPAGEISYVGSSTIALFLEDAEPVYRAIRFRVDSEPESEGGERAILAGETDLAGIANQPSSRTLRSGIASALIGSDGIAIIVNERNPVANLSISTLRQVFGGEIGNWREVGGPDLPLTPFIVGEGSATRAVFQNAVLDGASYAGCQEVQPDAAILEAVAADPGGIGQISFAFLEGARGVRAVAVGGEEPSVTNFDYPISRPLHFLWREGNPVLDAFIAWVKSEEGQRVVMRRFVGQNVLGSVRGLAEDTDQGTLVVFTETYPYYDGGIFYYPHRPYEIRSREGVLIRRVPNHRGENDEAPMRVDLAVGTYLIRTELASGEPAVFFVTIDPGRRTEVDVPLLLRGRR